jgi:acetate kinase
MTEVDEHFDAQCWSASLKFEVIATSNDLLPSQECKLASGIVEGIGERATFSLLQNKQTVHQQGINAADYAAATHHVFDWLSQNPKQSRITTDELDGVGHRVVHGGDRFTSHVRIEADVMKAIEDLKNWPHCITHRPLLAYAPACTPWKQHSDGGGV